MGYTTVAEIRASFPSAQWDPTRHEPSTATVESWIAEWSAALDGQLAAVVKVPVDLARSPNLHALCAQITRLRVRADVHDAKYAPGAGEQVTTRQSQVWRKAAEALVEQIVEGALADGEAAAAAATDSGPVGSFGPTGQAPFGQRDGVW